MESLLRSIVIVILSPVDVAFPSDLLSEIQSASTFIVYLMSPNCSKLETKSVLLVSKSPKFKVVGFDEYSDATTERGAKMRKVICDKLHFASLEFQSLDGLIKAIGLPADRVCTYCWSGKED